ncbi:unnamed protein product [Sphenostylis stenocarpa]|uniref:BRX domain-containing protein n=1 Tax=Sphenostylis stenocarpa TaxID=92480 RepID=A0AA86SG51_9FABA|nr:unnamed protein product [Sphenostylis stenocarpa]
MILPNGAKTQSGKAEWVVQDEPGVYVSLFPQPGGGNELKRVRFSRKHFTEEQAEKWWTENGTKILERHNVVALYIARHCTLHPWLYERLIVGPFYHSDIQYLCKEVVIGKCGKNGDDYSCASSWEQVAKVQYKNLHSNTTFFFLKFHVFLELTVLSRVFFTSPSLCAPQDFCY